MYSHTLAITVEVNSGATGATVSASLLAICLSVCIIVFTAITVVLIKAIKRAHMNLEREQRRTNSGVPRYEEVEHQPSRTSIATNKNIAYAKSQRLPDSVTVTVMSTRTESHDSERVYAQIS